MGIILQIEDSISSWKQSGGSERANFQTFANELCEVLDLPRPAPATEAARANSYCFENPLTFIHTGSKTRSFIDLYRAGHFLMEAKQGVTPDKPEDDAQPALMDILPSATRKGHGTRGTRGWGDTMMRARNQADGCARAITFQLAEVAVTGPLVRAIIATIQRVLPPAATWRQIKASSPNEHGSASVFSACMRLASGTPCDRRRTLTPGPSRNPAGLRRLPHTEKSCPKVHRMATSK